MERCDGFLVYRKPVYRVFQYLDTNTTPEDGRMSVWPCRRLAELSITIKYELEEGKVAVANCLYQE